MLTTVTLRETSVRKVEEVGPERACTVMAYCSVVSKSSAVSSRRTPVVRSNWKRLVGSPPVMEYLYVVVVIYTLLYVYYILC